LISRIVFSIVLFSSLPLPSFASDKLIPLENFVREDEYSQPRLSPDGKYIAITVRLPIKDRFVPTIMVYSLPEMKEQSAVRMPVFEVPHEYVWVTNTRLLVTKAKEFGSREAPMATGEIFAMDFDGKNQEYLYGYDMFNASKHRDKFGENRGTGSVTSIPSVRDGRFNMTVNLWDTDRSMLYSVDAKTANRKLLAQIAMPGAKFLIQHDGVPRFAYGGDKDGFGVLYRYDEKADEWNMVPRGKTGSSLTPFAFSPDDTEFYAFQSKTGEPAALVKENMKTGERVTLVSDSLGQINRLVWGAEKNLPFAAGTSIGIPTVRYIDPEAPEAKLHQLLSSKFLGNTINFINYTDDGSKLLFSVTSDREPGSYFIFDRTRNKAYPLFASKQAIDPDQMAERRPIKFKSRDGVELDAYFTLPKVQDLTKKLPMVVLPHGGPHGPSDQWYFDNDAQFLASRGYAVLQVNFRGSGGKGQKFESSGYRKWGAEIQNDLIDGVKWVIAQNNVDAERICTYGASFGGYSALMLAVREPDMFKCAIGYAGVYDLNLLFTSEEAKKKQFSTVMTMYVGRDTVELDKFSPAKHAEKIKIPVMLVHGKEDTRATFNHAEAMRDALIKVGRPPEWMAVADEGHGFYNTKNVTEFYQRLERFLAQHLGQ
jgi:dipeptidyl aminopeptidase/acylaminoacyl peptidase